jgi:hypothetical protein
MPQVNAGRASGMGSGSGSGLAELAWRLWFR